VKRKHYSVEQIVAILKQAEVGVGGGADSSGRDLGADFYRWKKQYVGLEVDQVRQLRQVQEENVSLKQLVAELTLDKTMLQDVLAKKCAALAATTVRDLPAGVLSGQRMAGVPGLPARSRDLHGRRRRSAAITGRGCRGSGSMSAFWADVLVAEGLVLRRWDPDSGDYRYAHALHARIGDPNRRDFPFHPLGN